MPDVLVFISGAAVATALLTLHGRLMARAEARARSGAQADFERRQRERNAAYDEGYKRGCGAHRDRSEYAGYALRERRGGYDA